MESDRIDRKLAALLSADVAGYSRLMAQDEEGTVERIGAYREEVSLLVQQHRGRLVDFSGDNFLAEFPSATDAVRSAVEIQRVLAARNADLACDHRLEFRIGVHLGDIRTEDGRLYGDGVNIAARLEALADAGGICVSSAVHEQVHGKLGLEFDHLGQRSLKNIPGPIRVYRVVLDGGEAPSRRDPGTRPARIALAISIVLLSAGGLVIAWSLTGEAPDGVEPSSAVLAASSAAERPTIAVLPFVNISGDAEQEYFVDGMTEDLITDLSKVSGLLVIARNSTFVYKNKPVKVQDVGRELGAAYVVEGSVRRAGDRLRITAQLL